MKQLMGKVAYSGPLALTIQRWDSSGSTNYLIHPSWKGNKRRRRGLCISWLGLHNPLLTPVLAQIQVGVWSSGFVHTSVCGHVCLLRLLRMGMLPHFVPPGCSETEAQVSPLGSKLRAFHWKMRCSSGPTNSFQKGDDFVNACLQGCSVGSQR